MIRGNAMQQLNNMIKAKNSRICTELNIDDIPKVFKEKFFSENLGDEIVYEYAVAYLGAVSAVVPAVKITAKERNQLYWHIAEVAKELGFFVIGEIKQEELAYIMESKMKLITEDNIIDAVIIENVDLSSNMEVLEHFLELLKEAEKAAFIKVRKIQEQNKKKWWNIFAKKEQVTTKDLFSNLCNKIERVCYDENGMPTYNSSIGLSIMETEDFQMVNPYIFSLICSEQISEEMVNIIDSEGQGGLVLINLANLKNCTYSEGSWTEIVREEATKKNMEINSAINKFYDIEDF